MKKPKYLRNIFSLMCIVFILGTSCTPPNSQPMEKRKTKMETTEGNKRIISAPIVLKNFVKKNGQSTDKQEMYAQLSVQDYFIKFCESEVSYETMQQHLSEISGDIKALKMEVEFREGSWDICDDSLNQQSRIGAYIVVYRILG